MWSEKKQLYPLSSTLKIATTINQISRVSVIFMAEGRKLQVHHEKN
jgi:hypothetical protein